MKMKVFVLLLLMFAACKTPRLPVEVPVKSIERHVRTYVPVKVPGDSVLLDAFFECDSLNNVLMRSIKESESKMKTAFQFYEGNFLYAVDFTPDTFYMPHDSLIIERDVPLYIEVPKIEYRQTWYQKMLTRAGVVSTAILLLLTAGRFLRK